MPVFSLLSLNSFGIPFYMAYGRIKRLTMELDRLSPTVICLQEIQQNAYLVLLQRGLTAYSHCAYFRNPFAPKGGLYTTSITDCPLMESKFYPFPNQGRPISIGFSDWALNKGVLVSKLEIQDRSIVVMNTHLQANYLGNWGLRNRQTQIQYDQVNYLVALVREQPQNAWVIICGDFNFPRRAPVYQQMVAETGLIDALVDDPRHTYLPFPLVPARDKWLTTLDYIFYRVPEGNTLGISADILPVVDSAAQHPIQRFLTDHKALILNIG